MANPHDQIKAVLADFKKGLILILGDKLHSAYVYGAIAFPESLPTGDIDFHVILKERLTDGEKRQLNDLHRDLMQRYPDRCKDLDGYYLLLEDTRGKTPPHSQLGNEPVDEAWALHREHIRAGRIILLYGEDPGMRYQPSTWSEIESALEGEIRFIQNSLDDHPDYCVLNLCRIIYSFRTKDVVISKVKASEWAIEMFPEWKGLITLARRSYEGKINAKESATLLKQVGNFYSFSLSIIHKLRSRM